MKLLVRMTTILFVLAAGSTLFAQRNDQQRARLRDAVEVELDIPYSKTDHDRQQLDLYLPKKRATDKPLPVIAFIHGGAWRQGDKRGGRGWLEPLVATGQYAGVSIGYRLSKHAKWPAQIHDCKAAIRWIRAHAERRGLDPDRIGVIGTSAGGHLVAALGTAGDVEKLEGEIGSASEQSSRVTCVVDFYGPSDMLTIGDPPSRINHNAADSPESQLVGGALKSHVRGSRSASPTTYVTEDDPPFLIVHGTNDPLVPYQQSVLLRDKLREAGVDVALITMQDGGHGGFRNRTLDARVRAFFDKHLLGKPGEFEDETLPAREQ